MENLSLPGNPRYQPKNMVDIFGYDNLYKTYVEVEMAPIEVLHDMDIISDSAFSKLNKNVRKALELITTSEVDVIERGETKHDIRALVKKIQSLIHPELQRWVHIPLTSYDVIDTGRSLQFIRAYDNVLKPSLEKLIAQFSEKVKEFASTPQIGRTHGQHALPITVGFWLATILSRIMFNFEEMERYSDGLVGKISGAVGAYNAQVGLGLKNFEEKVLDKLCLNPANISTQILPPEPLAYFLFSCTTMSASLGQFGRDGRNLMRTEISEIAEFFESGQVGSSTMAHKRNPINFENTEGMWIRTKNEFGKVMDTLISEHQRDLVGSCVARDFPIILINLQYQINTLLRKDKKGKTFLQKIVVNTKNCEENLKQSSGFVIAEPLYISLQMAGYTGDAHELVNKHLMPIAREKNISLLDALMLVANEDEQLRKIVQKIPSEVLGLLKEPNNYTGHAAEKALEIADYAECLLHEI